MSAIALRLQAPDGAVQHVQPTKGHRSFESIREAMNEAQLLVNGFIQWETNKFGPIILRGKLTQFDVPSDSSESVGGAITEGSYVFSIVFLDNL